MKHRKILIAFSLAVGLAGCSKLQEKLYDSKVVTSGGGNTDANALLIASYNDLGPLFHDQSQLFSLEENTTDECLVPTRGGDWDDNGVWRVLHQHAWDATHSQSSTVFNGLGKMESDATTVLAFNPGTEGAAEAYFLRSMAQFYYLDLYGQVPYRNVSSYNGIGPAPVLSASDAVDTLVSTLTRIIPLLNSSNAPYKASPDAARFLLMKVLLNKGAFLNRQNPTFSDADMQQVVSLGQQIMAGSYSFTPNYFDNFGPMNASLSREMILAYPNNGTSSNNGIAAAGINARWFMTLHYNSWDKQAPSAGWNGFSTVADFYNAFGADDKRAGGYFYPGVTDSSGLKPGMVVGQQIDENGNPEKDRKGNPLNFTPEVQLVETDPKTLEDAGIRVIKYPPDYDKAYSSHSRNQLIFFRYADVLLMVAEAKMRLASPDNQGAIDLINQVRSARGITTPLTSMSLVNPSNVSDPNTLLAERGREMYWESWRRQDLIRFGVYLKPWALKTTDDPKYLLFPIPSTQLVANPNLKQNPGY